MRATQSFNTVLKEARLTRSKLVASFDAFDVSDPLIMAVSLCFGVLTSSVYVGIADRALQLAAQAADFDDPLIATWITNQTQEHMLSIDSLERMASDVDALVDRDDYSLAVAAMKTRVTDEARAAIDTAFRVIGSRAFEADGELARLYRDVVAGIFHPRSAKSLAAALRNDFNDSR